jgi:hypothetical protein
MKTHILILIMLLISCAIISTIKSGSRNKVLEHLTSDITSDNTTAVARITDTYYALLKHFFIVSESIGDVNNGKFNVIANMNFDLCTRDATNNPKIADRCDSVALENFINNAKIRILNNIYTLKVYTLSINDMSVQTSDPSQTSITHIQIPNAVFKSICLSNPVLIWTLEYGLLKIKKTTSHSAENNIMVTNNVAYKSSDTYTVLEVSEVTEDVSFNIQDISNIKQPSNKLVKIYTVNYLHSALHSYIANIGRGDNTDYLSENRDYLYSNVFFAFKKAHLKELLNNNLLTFTGVNKSSDTNNDNIVFNITETDGVTQFKVGYNTGSSATNDTNSMSIDVNLNNIGETICVFIKYDIVQIVKYSYTTTDNIEITKKQNILSAFGNLSFKKQEFERFANTRKCICKLYIPSLDDPVNTNMLM